MRQTSRQIITVLTILALAGCTSIKEIDNQVEYLKEILEPGDHLVTYEKNGRVSDITLAYRDGDILKGTDQKSGKVVEINLHDIEKIEIEKLDGAKTAMAVAGGTLMVLVLAAGVMMGGTIAGFEAIEYQ